MSPAYGLLRVSPQERPGKTRRKITAAVHTACEVTHFEYQVLKQHRWTCIAKVRPGTCLEFHFALQIEHDGSLQFHAVPHDPADHFAATL